MPGTFDHKNDPVIKETEHNFHWPNQPDVVLNMSTRRIKDAAVSSLEPVSRLIYQELHDESTGDCAGYLPQFATVKVFWSLANKDQPS